MSGHSTPYILALGLDRTRKQEITGTGCVGRIGRGREDVRVKIRQGVHTTDLSQWRDGSRDEVLGPTPRAGRGMGEENVRKGLRKKGGREGGRMEGEV